MYLNFRDIAVAGVGAAVPAKIETVEELAARSGETDRFRLKRAAAFCGLQKRHVCPDDIYAGDLAATAGKSLLGNLGWDPATVDALFFVSLTPDFLSPPTGALVAAYLGLKSHCLITDINDGCPGMTHAAMLACGLMGPRCRRTLILCGTVMSKARQWINNPGTEILTGDGFGAMALEYAPDAPEISFLACSVPDTNFALPHYESGFRPVPGKPKSFPMKGDKVTGFCNEYVVKCAAEHLTQSGLATNDIDMFFFHQPNRSILDSINRALGIPPEKAPRILKDYANCHGASLAINMCANGKSGQNGKAMLCAFGTGFMVCSMLVELDATRIFDIVETDRPCLEICPD